MNEISFLISLAWAEEVLDVGDPMLKIEKCCEGIHDPPTLEKSENYFHSFDIPSIETQIVRKRSNHLTIKRTTVWNKIQFNSVKVV